MIQIEKISQELAESICRKITADLPEYFGLIDVNEHYAIGVRSRQNFAAKQDEDYLGLISIDFIYPNNANIYWMAVFRKHQGEGIGHKLIDAACRYVSEKGARTITVETLAPFESDENYLKTYHFYLSVGFLPLLNLKPQGYEWNMVYMVKTIETVSSIQTDFNISIRTLNEADIPIIVEAFERAHWPKSASTFENYLQEQLQKKRLVWLAYVDDKFSGYVTLTLKSQYEPFANRNIPEIMDLNVLPPFRSMGVGSKLLEVAEKETEKRSDIVGIGVGLYGGADGGYGAAQRLYVKRGYIPDSKGASYNYKPATPGDSFPRSGSLVDQKIKMNKTDEYIQ